jgi:hypothetical protein
LPPETRRFPSCLKRKIRYVCPSPRNRNRNLRPWRHRLPEHLQPGQQTCLWSPCRRGRPHPGRLPCSCSDCGLRRRGRARSAFSARLLARWGRLPTRDEGLQRSVARPACSRPDAAHAHAAIAECCSRANQSGRRAGAASGSGRLPCIDEAGPGSHVKPLPMAVCAPPGANLMGKEDANTRLRQPAPLR